MLSFLASFLGCDSPPPAPACEDGDELVFVTSAITFSRQENGISDGFDLDETVSTAGGTTGCGVADFTSPLGEPGIDNSFANLLPVLEATEAQAVESLIAQAIASGELLMLWRVRGIQSSESDDCVQVEGFRALGAPLVGNDGLLLPEQTFALDPSVPAVQAQGSISDGRLFAKDLEVELPVQIFSTYIPMVLHGAQIEFSLPNEHGPSSGRLAGGVETAIIQEVADGENVDDALSGIVAALLAYHADLEPDTSTGECQQLSFTVNTTLLPAFIWEE